MSADIECICMYGVALDRDDVFRMINVDFQKACEVEDFDDISDIDIYTVLEKHIKSPLTFEFIPDLDYFYIGIEISEMNNDETLRQFKKRIITEIKKIIIHGYKLEVQLNFGLITEGYTE